MDLGSDPTDPNNSLAITRTLAINSDGSYPDKRAAIPLFIRSTGPGNIPAGASSVTIQNVGTNNGAVLGVALGAGQSVSFQTQASQGMSAIAFDATNTVFLVTGVSNAPIPADPAFTQDPRGVGGFEGA